MEPELPVVIEFAYCCYYVIAALTTYQSSVLLQYKATLLLLKDSVQGSDTTGAE
jgi:hypothetical protein